MVVTQRLKNHFSFLKHNLIMNNMYQISYLHDSKNVYLIAFYVLYIQVFLSLKLT